MISHSSSEAGIKSHLPRWILAAILALAVGLSGSVQLAQAVGSQDSLTTITTADMNNHGSQKRTASSGASAPFEFRLQSGLPDLTITKNHTGNFVQGEQGIYTITVYNIGSGPTDGSTITVTDILPDGLTATDIFGTGWNCSVPPLLICDRTDVLDPGLSFPPITLTVTVATTAPANVTNTVSVSGGGESNGANNTAIDSTTVVQSDLVITNVTLSPPKPLPNQTFFINVEVRNQGGAATGSVPYVDIYINQDPTIYIDPTTGCPNQYGDYYHQVNSHFGLPANTTDIATIEVTGGLPPGYYQLWAYVDKDCTIAESDENNNLRGPTNVSIGHDNFDFASIISSIPYSDIDVDTTFAVTAADDPNIPNCNSNQGYASVWYSYTPSSDGSIYIDTYNTNYDTLIAVWTGTRGNLTSVTCNNDASGTLQSMVSLSVIAGTTYYIEIVHYGESAPPQIGGLLHLHVASFADVPGNYWAWRWIEGLYKAGITGGCAVSPSRLYCPDNPVTRAQMAIFLMKGVHGSSYTPPPVGASTGFGDVPTSYWAAAWIKQLAAEGITSGCGAGNYCPDNQVTRAQMAVFLLKAKHGTAYTPPPVGTSTGFTDVPIGYWAAAWIKQLAAEGITAGCGAGNYCPENPVTRAQMSVFLDRTFGLSPLP